MDFNQIKAILFDLDGVIVSSEQHWVATESSFLTGLLPDWDAERQKTLLGLSVRDVYVLLSSEHGLSIGWSDFLGYYDGRAGRIYSELAAEVVGAADCIRSASRSGRKTAIVSNSPRRWVELVVERFQIAPALTAVYSSEDVDTPGKPHPGLYLHALAGLGVEAREALAIEDSRKGVASAKAAGIVTVGLLNGYNKREQLQAADYIVEGFDDPWWKLAEQQIC